MCHPPPNYHQIAFFCNSSTWANDVQLNSAGVNKLKSVQQAKQGA